MTRAANMQFHATTFPARQAGHSSSWRQNAIHPRSGRTACCGHSDKTPPSGANLVERNHGPR